MTADFRTVKQSMSMPNVERMQASAEQTMTSPLTRVERVDNNGQATTSRKKQRAVFADCLLPNVVLDVIKYTSWLKGSYLYAAKDEEVLISWTF